MHGERCSKTYRGIKQELDRMPPWKKEIYNNLFATSAHARKLMIGDQDMYRPCIANGEKAIFHKWADEDLPILKFDGVIETKKLLQIREMYDKNELLPCGASITVIKRVLAIVEFEDGTIKEVASPEVKFLDSGNLFHTYALYFREAEES